MKRIAFLIVFSVMVTSAFSQIGIRAGVNVATVDAQKLPNFVDVGVKVGYQVGIDYDFKILSFLYFNPAVMYSTKGATFKYSLGVATAENTLSVNYIEIPVDFALRFRLGEDFKMGVFAGPYFSYLFSNSNSNDSYDKGTYNKTDYGAELGVGIHGRRFNLRAFYSLGLDNLLKHEIVEYKNSIIGVTLGYRL